jgi:hypothetical protein
MGSEYIRIVLEIEGEVVTERMVEKKMDKIEEIRLRWKHTYALKSRKKPYSIYVEIPSQMTPRKFKKYKNQYINNYEHENETIANNC